MSDSHWRTCDDPATMLASLGSRGNERKWWLFFVACARRLWYVSGRAPLWELASVAEGIAEGRSGPETLRNVIRNASGEPRVVSLLGWYMDVVGPRTARSAAVGLASGLRDASERGFQCRTLRELFDNPHRPVLLDPDWTAWEGGRVAQLAQAIYDDRAFDRMPILADALEESGCDNAALLDHCRGPGPHVRGCWVVDLLRGQD